MKKYFLISLFVLLANTFAKAQITTYSSYDNEVSAVYEVEDMESYEIKDYNSWAKAGVKHEASLMYINAYRAQINLINAPATIIDFHLYNDEENFGAAELNIEILNSTPKTIKEITLEFEFENYGTPVYDIKTGDRYMVLKYSNLSGRTKSDLYAEVADNIMKCYHLFQTKDATYKKLFYNKKANIVRLHSAKIKYSDGSTSTKIAVFDNGYNGKQSLFNDGPLSPIVKYINRLNEKETQETNKETSTNSYNSSEVFRSAAHMPAYPGGDAALLQYIESHMKYPQEAIDNYIQGKVIVQFVVKKDGTIGETKISRGVNPIIDEEAIRLVKTIPYFTPGSNAHGDAIDVWYTLPITFKLPGVY